jgi:hypothetical protein
MRFCVTIAVAGVVTALGGCANFLVPSGPAAERWDALEKARAAKQYAVVSGEEPICKNMPVMGSNIPQKVCSTPAEWDEFDRQARESVDVFDKDRKQGNTQGIFEN